MRPIELIIAVESEADRNWALGDSLREIHGSHGARTILSFLEVSSAAKLESFSLVVRVNPKFEERFLVMHFQLLGDGHDCGLIPFDAIPNMESGQRIRGFQRV